MKIKNPIALVIAVIFLSWSGIANAGGLQYFLKYDGVQGDSTVKGHEKEIRVNGYDFTADEEGNVTFEILKDLDAATIGFLTAMGDNAVVTNATLFGLNSAAAKIPRVKIVFTTIAVHSLRSVDTGGKETVPSERVTFSFGQAEITYYETDAKGKTTARTVTVIPSTAPPNS
jgi:type VI protein secretion system component Hcp